MASLHWADYEAMKKYDIPIPIGDFCKMRVATGRREWDWYAQLSSGEWYWFDGRQRGWKHCPNGPL